MEFQSSDPRQMEPYQEPVAENITGLFVGLSTACVLSSLCTHKYLSVKEWKRLPWIIWLVLFIYLSSVVFVFGFVIIQYGIEASSSSAACSSPSLLCLGAYLASKTFIYLFLVDRAHIIRRTTKSRSKSKLYIWNCFGMVAIYTIIGTLGLIYQKYRLENEMHHWRKK
ncbi:hypothetical protein BKA67DRAFT_585279 [Truncatella angustata]|uniref:Uncharacterized protein n=1 Tax=Truncatella angustata TaxID=152316 RepID=A0A9P8RGE0_9PEZI|nr:uncharacterized protein BKA67DRAFT_585279 [Truncatella angustata]KAH6645519.1 hypothetical protein BKA67DRAFT_585279 [Truncatella angustata]